MNIPVELTNTPLAVRKRIRQMLQASPNIEVSESPPVLAPDAPPTVWFHPVTQVAFLFVGGTFREIYGRGRVTASPTPPPGPNLPNDEWYETSTGSSFIYYDGYWVERIARAEFPNSEIVPATTTPFTLTIACVNNYVRFADNGAKVLQVPAVSGSFDAPKGCVVTIRNASTSGNITLTALSGVQLKGGVGDSSVPPNTTAQIMHQGLNIWDIL